MVVFAAVSLLSHIPAGFTAEPGVAEDTGTTPAVDAVPPDVAALMATAESGQAEDRRRAILALGDLGERGSPAMPLLIRMLSDSNQELRECAINSLQRLGPYAKPAVPALIQLLEEGDASHDLWTVVLALQKIGDQRAVAPLTAVLRSSVGSNSSMALCAILDIGGQPAIPFLLQVLNQPLNNSSARSVAAYYLGKCKEPEATDALLAIATNRNEPSYLRACVIKAMRCSTDHRVIEVATAALADKTEDREIRIAAACVLADLAGRDAVDKLAAVVHDTADDIQVRFWAALDLVLILDGRIDDVEIVRALKGEPKMFVFRREKEMYQRAFDSRRAVFHALIDHGQAPAVQSEAKQLLGELMHPRLVHPRKDVSAQPCSSDSINLGYDPWVTLCLSVVLGLLAVVYACRFKWNRFEVTAFLLLVALVAFSLSIRSLCNITSTPDVERRPDAKDIAQTDDLEWATATTCEKSWVDDSSDNLPRLHPIEFRGKHYSAPHVDSSEPHSFSSERLQQILARGTNQGTATTEATKNNSNQSGGNVVLEKDSDQP